MTLFIDGLVGIGKPFVYNIVVVTLFALKGHIMLLLFYFKLHKLHIQLSSFQSR